MNDDALPALPLHTVMNDDAFTAGLVWFVMVYSRGREEDDDEGKKKMLITAVKWR